MAHQQLPILTMPNDDTRTRARPYSYSPRADCSEPRAVPARDLPTGMSCLRFRDCEGYIGEGFTRPDHPHVASQLYAAEAAASDPARWPL